LFDEAVFVSQGVIDYHLDISREGYRDVLTFEVETDNPSDELADSIIKAVSSIMAIEDGLSEDLVAVPRVKFVGPMHEEYAVKPKKIIDLRE
ncbi:MAG: hypothetical protein J6O90_05140, partial [Candidatus Methanomethylophilaceae archaeon]|nr:hypothetical protein [Candidatus Methanomethylophilaceae archaeon]